MRCKHERGLEEAEAKREGTVKSQASQEARVGGEVTRGGSGYTAAEPGAARSALFIKSVMAHRTIPLSIVPTPNPKHMEASTRFCCCPSLTSVKDDAGLGAEEVDASEATDEGLEEAVVLDADERATDLAALPVGGAREAKRAEGRDVFVVSFEVEVLLSDSEAATLVAASCAARCLSLRVRNVTETMI